jgi:hypothetical protein
LDGGLIFQKNKNSNKMAAPFFISAPYNIQTFAGNETFGIVSYSVDVQCEEGQTTNQQSFTILYNLALTEAEFNQHLVDNALTNAVEWCSFYVEPPAE